MVLRSRFWNSVLAAVMVTFAFLSTAVAVSGVDSGSVATWLIFGAMAIVFWAGVFRALMLGVKIRSDSIVARGLGRTTVIRFEEMDRVEVIGLVNGK